MRDLHIDHGFLNDLLVYGSWNGQRRATLWNRKVSEDKMGVDDDFLPFTGDDIDFDFGTTSPSLVSQLTAPLR